MSKRPKPKRKKGKAGRPAERLAHIPDVQAALDKLLNKPPKK
jgi:hypothetical protein